jgi:hypothetical protein
MFPVSSIMARMTLKRAKRWAVIADEVTNVPETRDVVGRVMTQGRETEAIPHGIEQTIVACGVLRCRDRREHDMPEGGATEPAMVERGPVCPRHPDQPIKDSSRAPHHSTEYRRHGGLCPAPATG